jgi:hypothetical protein
MVCWLCREIIASLEESVKVVVGINAYSEQRVFHKTCFNKYRGQCLRADHGGHHVSESSKK